MTGRRRLFGLLVLGAAGTLLAACGRKGRPQNPEGTVYPRPYPYTAFPRPPAPAGSEADTRRPSEPTDQDR